MNKKFRFLSVSLLSALLAISSVQGIRAEESDNDFTILGSKYLTDLSGNGGSDIQTSVYDDDEVLDIIVELNDKPIVDYVEDGNVLNFTLSAQGRSIESSLEAQQADVLRQVETIAEESLEVQYSYTRVMNGFAIETEYKNLAAINELPNVKRAYVAQIYDRVEPLMEYSVGTVGATTVWNNLSYKGENTVVGILDTGLDLRHPAFQQELTDVKVTQADIERIVADNTLKAEEFVSGVTASDLYHSSKVPFQFDYADSDASVSPESDLTAAEVDHGTHVAGTVGGYDEAASFSGIAPNAQLMIFKVFSDKGGGASSVSITAALDDAVLLDIDVINMSLGSSAGFSYAADDSLDDVYNRVGAAGIVLDISAGNSTDAAANNLWGISQTPTANPDHGIVGSPSTYRSALSIASMDNTFMINSGLKVDDELFAFTDTSVSITTIQGKTYDYVMVPGVGDVSDYEGVNVTGKIAVIARGAIDFQSKVANAADKGAVAAFIYNNTSGALLNMASDGNAIPAIFISDVNGQTLANRASKTLEIKLDTVVAENTDTASLPSDFSSAGTTNLLEIKPELAAPGGFIYSSVPAGTGYTYASMSGTSMASPHVAGISALAKQHVNTIDPDLTDLEKVELINKLLMSTATPATSANDVEYPVRKQGAGMVNVYKALETPAYLSSTAQNSDGTNRPKLELGDDVSKSGVYTLNFDVTNISDTALTYDIDVSTTTPSYDSYYGGLYNFMNDTNIDLNSIVSGDTSVTVEPNSTKSVSVTVTLDDAKVDELNEVFENGFYVEGYATLTPTTGTPDDITLSIPYLAFYGDWEQAPTIEKGSWINNEDSNNWVNDAHDGTILLGKNYFTGPAFDINPEMLAISPNGDGMLDKIVVREGLIRNADRLKHTVTSNDTGAEVYLFEYEKAFKTYYNSTAAMQAPYNMYFNLPNFNGVDSEGKALPDGSYTYTVETDLGYREGYDDSFSFDFLIDTVAPKPVAVGDLYTKEDGRTYLKFKVVDENYVIYSTVFSGTFTGSAIEDEEEIQTQYTPNSGVSEHTYTVDVTNLLGKNIFIETYDEAMNGEVYALTVPTPEVNADEVTLVVGETTTLTVDDSVDPLLVSWASLDESVATVDATGLVTAVAKGETDVTLSVDGDVVRTIKVTVLTNADVLQAAVDAAKAVENLGYTEASWTTYQDAIASAEAVLANPDATQQDYLDAIAALKDAKNALVGVVTGLPANLEVKVGNTFTLNPQPAGGEWSFDSSILKVVTASSDSARLNARAVGTSFEVIGTGSTTLTYTAPNGAVATVQVTASKKDGGTKPNPDEPGTGDPSDPTDDGNTNPGDNGNGGNTGNGELPATGIQSQSYAYAYVMIAIGGAFVITTILRKKKEVKM